AAPAAPAMPAPASTTAIVFKDVRVFDGITGTVSAPANVLVRGNLIERISAGPLSDPGAEVIDGGGSRVLMPGLIDAHWHSMMAAPSLGAILGGDQRYLTVVAAAESTRTLMRGFTTVRDLGGNAFGLKQAVDA